MLICKFNCYCILTRCKWQIADTTSTISILHTLYFRFGRTFYRHRQTTNTSFFSNNSKLS
ncbi:unnamed protein product [Schistosoma mattheei]|uniref:Uncharacterized protein n=2 Tax=Schistosoma TaxID=6181 RepID=A0A183L8P6_9TREM|nr:unnamed protein product [Schistosoma margrebowiei]VDP38922.1 unnamed protein product [Schistosoma mattheei]